MALSDFQQIRKLGAGGQGEVFEVLHRPTGRHLALKLALTPESPPPATSHGNAAWPAHSLILDPLASGWTDTGIRWQVFQLLAPADCGLVVKESGPAAALSLLCQAAAAVAHVHSHGWLIADLKPDNLIIEATGAADPWLAWRLRLIDLDLARPASSDVTELSGTQGYLAPELLSGSASQSKTADVFALGAWLLWLVSGREPFLGELNADRLVDRVSIEIATPPARYDSRFNGAIWGHVFSRMLDPDPHTRLQDGIQLLSFLANHASNDEAWSRCMPSLVWNRRSPSPTDSSLLKRVSRILDETGDLAVLVLRYNRRSFSAEFLDSLFLEMDWGLPVVIQPSTQSGDVLGQIDKSSSGAIVIDVSNCHGLDELAMAAQSLEMATLSGQARIGGKPPVVLLANMVQDLTSLQLQELGSGVLECSADRLESGSLKRWSDELFSTIPVSSSLLDSIAGKGGLDPNRVDQVLDIANQKTALKIISGSVSLLEEDRDQVLNEVLSLNAPITVSAAARALRQVAGAVPGGIRVRWVPLEELGVSLGELVRMEALGLLKLPRESGAISLILADGPANSFEASDCLHEVRSILANAVARSDADNLGNPVVGVALRFPDAVDDSSEYRRGRALARALVRRGEYASSLRLLEIRRAMRPSKSLKVARVLDLLLEARAAVKLGELDTARGRLRDALEVVNAGMGRWISVRVRVASAILEFEHGNRSLAAHYVKECEGLLDASTEPISAQLRAATSLLVLRLRITDLNDPSLEAHFRGIIEDPVVSGRLKAAALAKWGRRLFAMGDSIGARRSFAQALRVARRLQDIETFGAVFTPIMAYHFSRGFLARTSRFLDRVARLPQSGLSVADRTAWMSGKGALAYEQGHIRRAYDVNIHLYELSKQLGHQVLRSSATLNIGLLLNLMNHPAASRRYLQESDRLSRAAQTKTWEMALIHLAEVELDLGRRAAVAAILESLEASRSTGSSDLVGAHVHRLRGRLFLASASKEAGLESLAHACRAFSGLNAPDEVILTELDMLSVVLGEGSAERLAEEAQQLIVRAARLGNWRISALTTLLGIRAGVGGDAPFVERTLRSLVGESLDRGFVRLELAALELLCERQLDEGWIDEARDSLRSVTDRIRSAAKEFVDPELRSQYLGSPARQRFKQLALRVS